MNRQVQSQKHKISLKKPSTKKQHGQQTLNKNQQKIHNDKYVLEPIITVNGEKKYKRYEKIKKIGKGTYSQCFLVKTVGSQSFYALKIIPKSKLQVLIRQKLIYEIKIQQQLSHPHVVYLDHWFEDDDFQYIFMEYCPNGTLESKLRQMTEFPQSLIRKYVRQIVQSLIYIHSKNVLHRDLKMCNFYIDQNDNVKLGDFGFACQLNHAQQLKRQTCGTPNYIAPESISGFGYSFTADVWSVGVILYRMKFAVCPFQGSSVKNTLQNVKLCRYTFPKGQKISTELKDLITKIFNLNYDQRLTLEQIYSHRFFQQQSSNSFSKHKKQEQKKQKRGFSLSRLFSSTKQKALQKALDSPKNKKPVRSNSCQTFKKIKQTLKEKQLNTLVSNNTLQTQQNVYYGGSKTQTYITMGPSITARYDSSNPSKTVRDIVDSFNLTNGNYLLSNNDFQTKNDRNSRLNQFLAQQVTNKATFLNIKEKAKIDSLSNSRMSKPQGDRKRIFQQLLNNFQKKYFFPLAYKYEKQILIITFPENLKLIIFPKSEGIDDKNSQNKSNTRPQVLILHKNKFSLYNLSQKRQKVEFQKLPKLLKYIIDKKVSFQEQIVQSEDFLNNELDFQTLVNKLPNLVLHKKQGVLLSYGTKIKGYYVAKSSTQEFQYLSSLEQKKLNTLFKYNFEKKKHEVEQGPVLSKIYSGWTQQLLTGLNQK